MYFRELTDAMQNVKHVLWKLTDACKVKHVLWELWQPLAIPTIIFLEHTSAEVSTSFTFYLTHHLGQGGGVTLPGAMEDNRWRCTLPHCGQKALP